MATVTRFLGNNARLTLALTHPDTGALFDPAGHVLLFTVKLHPSLPDTAAKIQKLSTVGGLTVLGVGSLAVDLVPADAANLKAGLEYYMDVLAQHSGNGQCLTVHKGRLVFESVVTSTPSLSIPTNTTNPGGTGVSTPQLAPTITNQAQHVALATVGAVLPWVILTLEGGVWVTWTLRARTGGDDPVTYPDFLRVPTDFHAGTNNVIWARSAFS